MRTTRRAWVMMFVVLFSSCFGKPGGGAPVIPPRQAMIFIWLPPNDGTGYWRLRLWHSGVPVEVVMVEVGPESIPEEFAEDSPDAAYKLYRAGFWMTKGEEYAFDLEWVGSAGPQLIATDSFVDPGTPVVEIIQ